MAKSSKTFQREFRCSAEIETPSHIKVEISYQLADKIRLWVKTIQQLKVFTITVFDYSPVFLRTDYEDDDRLVAMEDFRTDCQELVVSETNFWWSGNIKNTDIGWTTDSIDIKELP